jgi:chromosome segregation ATPase
MRSLCCLYRSVQQLQSAYAGYETRHKHLIATQATLVAKISEVNKQKQLANVSFMDVQQQAGASTQLLQELSRAALELEATLKSVAAAVKQAGQDAGELRDYIVTLSELETTARCGAWAVLARCSACLC